MTYHTDGDPRAGLYDNTEFWGFLLAELGATGATHEVVAQWLASSFIVGSMEGQEISQELSAIFGRIVELMDTQGQIWPGLMPGPPIEPKWKIVENNTSPMRRGYIVKLMMTGTDNSLFYDPIKMVHYVAELGSYNNISHPDSDEVGEGMLIELPEFETTDLSATEYTEIIKNAKWL